MVSLSFSAEREGLATALPVVAPLNVFPFCLSQGPLQNILLVKVDKSTSLFFTQCLMQISLHRHHDKKQKVSKFRHLFTR